MASTINRIVGQNSGIDVDTVVKQSLSKEQEKIDKAYQNQMLYTYEQEQLLEIVNTTRDFMDKYLSTSSKDSMRLASTYETVKFTSSDDSVSAVGYAGADITNYNVTVNQIATKASKVLRENDFKEVMDSNKGVIGVSIKNSKGECIEAYAQVVLNGGEVDMEATSDALNAELRKKGLNVTAKYSQFSRGIELQSNKMGEDIHFEYGIQDGITLADQATDEANHRKFSDRFDSFETVSGTNAKGVIVKANGEMYQIDSSNNTINLDNIKFTLNKANSISSESNILADAVSELSIDNVDGKIINYKASDNTGIVNTKETEANIVTTKTYNGGITVKQVKIKSTGEVRYTASENLTALKDTDKDVTTKVENGTTTIESKDGKIKTTIENSREDGKLVTTTTTVKVMDDGKHLKTVTIQKGEGDESTKETNTYLVEGLEELNIDTAKEITVETSDGKTKSNFIMDGHGSKISSTTTQVQDDGSVKVSSTNDASVTTKTYNKTTLTGKSDVTGLKDKIVKFVDEYNKVIEAIDKKLWEKRDKDYMPLTEEQKKEMSQSQIDAWEKKVKTGLLRNDSDLNTLKNSMRDAMGSIMSGSGLSLDDLGIKPIKNYTNKNGMYEVDENKLTEALESNSEEIRDLFTRAANGNDKGGIITRMQKSLYDQIDRTNGNCELAKRIGFEGTRTESNNTLTKAINEQKKLIKQLKKTYTTKENALYKKYSNLEVQLQKLNAQSSSLYSMLGIS